MTGLGNTNRKRKHSSSSNGNCKSRVSTNRKDSKEEADLKRKRSDSSNAQVRSEGNLPQVLEKPEVRNRFIIGGELGRGTYGVVFAGWDMKKKMPVAIKVVLRSAAKWIRKGKSRIPMEVYLQQRLDHPNIVKLLTYTADVTHIAMFIERPLGYICLDDLMLMRERKTGAETLSEKEAKIIFKHVARGMQYCLSRQVYHHDLSAFNILVDPETLDAKIIDFGCASIVKPEGHFKIRGNIEATPPEYLKLKDWQALQLEGKSSVTDLPKPVYADEGVAWECGAILYEMVVGCDVYDDINNVDLTFYGTSEGFQCFVSKLLTTEADSRITLQQALVDQYMQY